ncbi:acyl-CoA dehydrogenase family protein [Streptomyces malaysiensis]|uniref:Acyl-CoA dehydrogenase domain-containing protein n=1 Tax=Streptomyces malaysiensis TaxID=92644 RepID=A0A7X5X044_STRMQ|nr:acyl-CoA dehydrogenase family protein [Streptomyces malaysiensis]NIY64214.1 acyl-CoA dehydrogenase domain-containing protein [Streptomyces malaysiensis]
MDLRFSEEDEAFRAEVRAWLADNLTGEFANARGLGGPGREHEAFPLRLAWERRLGEAGWTCLGWPREHGGRGASLARQVIFHEEYVRADAPVRVGHIGEGLIGPTLIDLGTEEQKDRFLPPILRGEELWCQGYSEPDAGSDLAGVRTRARLDGDEWVIDGQKVWTSLAHEADWCFVLARTDPATTRHAGLSYLLVPMRQPGVEIRPIVQITGTSEFNEVFFDGARTPRENVVGAVGDGWRVAMATLAYERGASTLGQQLGFRQEFDRVAAIARENGAIDDPVLRDRLVRSWIELEIMRLNALRTMTSLGDGEPGPEVSFAKLYWSTWHREFGELAMDVLGIDGLLAEGPPYDLSFAQRVFLFSRADTIYAGSSEIQRNIIAERTLGLPRARGKGSS